MSRVSPPQNGFPSGELTPLMAGRPDTARYQSGLARCRGYFPLLQGPVTRMPGTKYLGSVKDDAEARLIPFVHSEADFYALEFGAQTMRVWRDYTLVQSGGSPFEMATPYALADVKVLQGVRSKDRLYQADGARAPQRISRYDHDDWRIEATPFENGPFRAENTDQAVTVHASGESGTVTLTASAQLFEADHVGGLFQLRQVDQPVPAIKAGEELAIGDRRSSGGRVYEAATAGGTNSVPSHGEGTVSGESGDASLTYIHDEFGVVRIDTADPSGLTATATVLRTLPAGVITGTVGGEPYTESTYRWSEGAWSARHGYPRAIARHLQRVIYGGTANDPDTISASASGSFTDFTPSTEDDGAFSVRVDVEDSDLGTIEWLVSTGRRLTLGGFSAIAVSTTPKGEVFGPNTVSFDLAAKIGVRRVPPVVPADGAPIYVPRLGQALHQVDYEFETDRDRSSDLTKAASHILGPKAVELAWQFAPVPMVWARIGDGELAGLVLDRDEQLLGFCRANLGGAIESYCVLPDGAGSQEVWMIVKREIGGETKRFVEVMQQPFALFEEEGATPLTDAWHVLAGIRYEGAAANSFSGLDHLEGETVVIWSAHGDYEAVVENGAVSLPDGMTASIAVIGLPGPTPEIASLDVVAGAQDGGSQGRDKRIRRIAARLKDTVGGEVRVRMRRDGQWDDGPWLPLTETGRPFTEPVLFNGLVDLPPLGGWGHEVRIEIRPSPGAPMTLCAFTPTMRTSDD